MRKKKGVYIFKSQLSWGKLRRKPATRWFDESIAPIPMSYERFARQYRDELPSEFPLTSLYTGIVHHLSDSNQCARTQFFHRPSVFVCFFGFFWFYWFFFWFFFWFVFWVFFFFSNFLKKRGKNKKKKITKKKKKKINKEKKKKKKKQKRKKREPKKRKKKRKGRDPDWSVVQCLCDPN